LCGTIILGIYRDGYVSSILFFMTLVVPLVSYILAVITKETFKLYESIDRRIVVKGDVVTYTYRIYNSTPFLCCPMSIVFTDSKVLFKGSILEEQDEFILYPKEVRESIKTVDCNYRGGYYIGIDKVVVRDFLNLFSLSYKNGEKQKVVVYPLIRELRESDKKELVIDATESIISVSRFNPSVFSSIRDYIPGDSKKQIHWKLSAKHGNLLTKEFEGSLNNKSKILLNSDALPFGFQENIVIEDYMIEGIVSVVNYLLMNNTPVTMSYYRFQEKHLSGVSSKDFGAFYLVLAELSFGEECFKETLIKAFRTSQNNMELLIFTPFITKELSDCIIKMKPSHLNIKIYIIDANKTLLSHYIEMLDKRCIYELIAVGITVYKISFEKGLCRLEVA
jgi:hypothetical protein